MDTEPVYTGSDEAESCAVTTALTIPEVDRSPLGPLYGAITWIRTASTAGIELVDSHCPSTWRQFLEVEGFAPFGGVAETFPFLPLLGRRSSCFRSEDRRVVAAVTRSRYRTTLTFWALFSDGLIVTMSNAGASWLRRAEVDPASFVRYPMTEAPRDDYEYFTAALRHFEEGDRVLVPFESDDSVVSLTREYWRRRPALFDAPRALGVPGFALGGFCFIWLAHGLFSLWLFLF